MELVPYLLRLLEGIGLETLDNPSATKAQIVKALKSMTRSLQFGEQVKDYHCCLFLFTCVGYSSHLKPCINPCCAGE